MRNRSQRALFGLCLGTGLLLGASAQATVVISKKPTQNMTCSGGVCSPTAADAVLNVDDLANMLAASDIRVVSDSSAVDIVVNAALSWTSGNRLTLDSYHSIDFKKPVSVAGPGGLTLTANDGGTGGDLSFVNKGKVEFWDLHSSLIIDGTSYKLVKNIAQLAKAVAKNPAGAYALAKSYNASKDGTYSQSPVATAYSGTFEGLGNTISGLQIDDAADNDNVGLFSQLSGSGLLRDVLLTDAVVNAEGSAHYVGVLLGCCGTIKNAQASGTVTAPTSQVAGVLAGSATADNSSSSGSVIGGQYAGGLMGGGTVTYSHSTANVGTTEFGLAGGLVGGTSYVRYSYATGSVIGSGHAGGLAGENDGTVYFSFATGPVSGGTDSGAGGLIGYQYLSSMTVYSYATGTVTGGASQNLFAAAGGLIGAKSAYVIECYSIGSVTGQSGDYVGGFFGVDNENFYNNIDYWNVETSGQSGSAGNNSTDAGVIGLTTAQFQSGLPSGFEPTVWGEKRNINNGYPYLLANPPPK